MAWKIVATFSKAKEKKCSTVALRTSWPTKNQEGEAFGATCVE